MKKITIRDIARKAGVGVGTVSRVLNNSNQVSEETRTRIVDVMRALDYMPSAAAIRLARRANNATIIGLLLPDIGNHFFFEIFEVIYQELRTKGVDILIFNYEEHHVEVINKILDSAVSILLIFNFHLDEQEKELLFNRNVQYLYVDSPVLSERCLYTDNIYGGILAATFLISRGVSRPCYIADIQNSTSSQDRLAGFRQAFDSKGIREIGLYTSTLTEESGRLIAQEIITTELYDGVFCFCDEIAAGVISVAREKKVNLQVIGYDGLQISRFLSFSTISQHPRKIGSIVSNLVIKMLTNEIGMKDSIVHKITPELIERI
ncbi:LacI family DNA-binding transcriptional regulator [uncultured Sphaerochaeta sp.]|uniref:LacI family DNA-binding transcriptional regulator n=1 Tax=uncultured Sphaerochaeta sp. TaxID=886478 RepID=UPI002AA92701|nr:LacI family DNA-binding transcriptional regulator [uncultured Sphaerochaeta sp.]